MKSIYHKAKALVDKIFDAHSVDDIRRLRCSEEFFDLAHLVEKGDVEHNVIYYAKTMIASWKRHEIEPHHFEDLDKALEQLKEFRKYPEQDEFYEEPKDLDN